MRLSKQQAAARLEVSTATIERKIQRGELKAEKEPHGSRYRVWVIFDDDETVEAAVATPVETPVATLLRRDEPSVETSVATPLPPEVAPAVEMARLQERNKALEELADYHRQLLSDSEWRFQEMVHQLKQSNETIATLSRALPEPKGESDDTASPAAVASAEKERRRPRWWPFGRK
jgi:excisionase family DNA binding protein